eukprot:s644_g2.t1
MSQNGNRTIGMYDDGRFLLRALSNGESSAFNASTMSKLFNGSVWKRTVVKDHNRFSMHHTCLCLCMTLHIEEWHKFLSKDGGALGMQSRFPTLHSSPCLDKAAAVLDAEVYQAEHAEAPVHDPFLLHKFVHVLTHTDRAHASEQDYIPYYFAPDALECFTTRFDQQEAYPGAKLPAEDCDFVMQKLENHAPHLLGTALRIPPRIPFKCELPAVKPRTGHQMTFTKDEQAKSCHAQWDRMTKARRSGGLLVAVKPCQIIGAVKLVCTYESPTGVYFFLAELLDSFAEARGAELKRVSRKKRLQFLRTHLSLVWYDYACAFKKFITAKKRRNRNKITRALSKLPERPYGMSTRWPQTHMQFGHVNDSAAEQAFAFC